MTHRTRERNRQLASRVVITKQHITDSIAQFLTEVPALKDHWHFLNEIVKRQRTAIEHKCDDRFARRHHGIDKLILSSNQVKIGSVAKVIKSPSLTRHLFILANGQDDDIRCTCNPDGLCDLPAIILGL